MASPLILAERRTGDAVFTASEFPVRARVDVARRGGEVGGDGNALKRCEAFEREGGMGVEGRGMRV